MRILKCFTALCVLAGFVTALHAAETGPSFAIAFPNALGKAPLDGRMVLLLSTDSATEPRLQSDPDMPLKTPFMFGETVDQMKPGQEYRHGQQCLRLAGRQPRGP
jgi:hypothetical protein